jgi:hypothetical protein
MRAQLAVRVTASGVAECGSDLFHLAYSTVTLNSTGLFTLNNGVIYTAGNNSVIGNLVENVGGGANVVFFKSDVTS